MEVQNYWILILIFVLEIFTCIQGRKNISKEVKGRSNLEGFNLRKHKEQKTSNSKATIVTAYHDAIIVKLPKFNKCKELEKFKFVTRTTKGKKTVKTGKMNTCVELGRNRFYFGKVKGEEAREGIFFLQRKGDTKPFKVLYGNLPEKSTKEPPIAWAIVGSSGPGWIDLRFKSQGVWADYMTYWVHYTKVRYNTMGDRVVNTLDVKPAMNNFINYKYSPLTVQPAFPCPEWEDSSIFCILLTDYVDPEPESIELYSDYQITIFSKKVDKKDDANSSQTRGGEDEPYTTIVRVWETCDPTYSCSRYMQPLESASDSGPHLGVYAYDNLTLSSSTMPAYEEYEDTGLLRHNPAKKAPKVVLVMRKLWPLFLAIFFIVLLIVVPLFFFLIRRRSMQERISNWYTGTTPTGLVDYAMALPVHVQIPPTNRSSQGRGRGRGGGGRGGGGRGGGGRGGGGRGGGGRGGGGRGGGGQGRSRSAAR